MNLQKFPEHNPNVMTSLEYGIWVQLKQLAMFIVTAYLAFHYHIFIAFLWPNESV